LTEALLPSLRSLDNRRAAVVGLGAGHTVTTLLAGGFGRLDVIELEPAVVEAARFMHRSMGKRFPLDDRRARSYLDDGRARIGVSRASTYDAVVSQPSHPWLAGSSTLYTREFFADVRRVLRPGGVFVFWVNRFRMDLPHIRQVVGTAAVEFPWLEAWGTENDLIVVAARDLRRPTPAAVDARVARAPELQEILRARSMWPLPRLAAFAEMDDAAARAFVRGARVITDDRPSLEYELSHLPNAQSVTLADLDRALSRTAWTAPALGDTAGTLQAVLARVDAAGNRPAAIARIERGLPGLGLPASAAAVAEGALAEARGDTRLALAAYARSSGPEGLVRRAKLLAAVGDDAGLLAVVRPDPSVPGTARREAAIAAVRLGRWSEAGTRGAMLDPEDAALGRAVVALSTARASGRCMELPRALERRAIRGEPALLWAAGTCAIEAGATDAAREFLAAADVAARSRAVALVDRGLALGQGGNQRAALQALEASLRWNPANGVAATTLARAHARAGDRDAARAVLEAALEAAYGLPRTTDQLLTVGASLQIRLQGGATRADRGATGTSTATPAAGGSGAGGD
jgi:SAM-dependent methyltransferase